MRLVQLWGPGRQRQPEQTVRSRRNAARHDFYMAYGSCSKNQEACRQLTPSVAPSVLAMPLVCRPESCEMTSRWEKCLESSTKCVRGAPRASKACVNWQRRHQPVGLPPVAQLYALSAPSCTYGDLQQFKRDLDSHALPCCERRTELARQHQRRVPGCLIPCHAACIGCKAATTARYVDPSGCCGGGRHRRTPTARPPGGSPSSSPLRSGKSSSSRAAGRRGYGGGVGRGWQDWAAARRAWRNEGAAAHRFPRGPAWRAWPAVGAWLHCRPRSLPAP